MLIEKSMDDKNKDVDRNMIQIYLTERKAEEIKNIGTVKNYFIRYI